MMKRNNCAVRSRPAKARKAERALTGAQDEAREVAVTVKSKALLMRFAGELC